MSTDSFHYSPVRSILGANEEDRFTGYLAGLLAEPPMLKGFIDLSPGIRVAPEDFASLVVDIQVRVVGGRPDLVISGDNTLLIYEAKVGSWIHGSQLVEYSKHIRAWKRENPKGLASLILIAPSAQLGGLLKQGNADVKGLKVSGISWESIADLSLDVSKETASTKTQVHLQDFSELIHYRLGEIGRPFTQEELQILTDRQFAESLNRVYSLIPGCVSRIEKGVGADLKAKRSNGSGFTGYHFYFRGSKFWFGVWMHTWAAIGDSPLCLQIFQHIPNDLAWPESIHRPIRGRWNGKIVPLRLIDGIDRDELEGTVASQVEDIVNFLNPA